MDQRLDEPYFNSWVETPLGLLKVTYNHTHIERVYFENNALDIPHNTIHNQIFNDFKKQISFYFSNKLKSFDLPTLPAGTAFQKNVWKALQDIPFGTYSSYMDVAIKLGGKEKTRAVASAIAKNPILILIPCHRVISSDGKLNGFSGGVHRKKALLEIEGLRIDF